MEGGKRRVRVFVLNLGPFDLPSVECDRLDLRDVYTEAAVDARAVEAEKDAEIHRRPAWAWSAKDQDELSAWFLVLRPLRDGNVGKYISKKETRRNKQSARRLQGEVRS